MSKITINKETIRRCHLIENPVYKWEFRCFKDDNNIYMRENAPNCFYRFMQKIILGVHWKKIKEVSDDK